MAIELRDYQEAAIAGLFTYWQEPATQGKFPVVVLPTGAGKTFTLAVLIKKLLEGWGDVNILVLAHMKELIQQLEGSIRAINPTAEIGVYAASENRKELKRITVASRQTLVNLLKKHRPRFDIVFIDECHLVAPDEESGYRKIIAALSEVNPEVMVVGLSATPYRQGQGYVYGECDKTLFDGVAYERTLREMIQEGYLVRPVARVIGQGQIDTDGIKTTAGDFNKKQLAIRAEDPSGVRAMVDDWERQLERDPRQLSVFYCCSVAHAEMVAEFVRAKGYDCPVVTGTTPKAEREAILAGLKAGRFDAVANVGVLTTGTDIPIIDCIVMARPTKALSLFLQMVGRGLRLCEGKVDCLLLDYGGCLERFGPLDIAQPPARRQADNRIKSCPNCDEIVGYHKRRCQCGYEFEPQPVKECPQCGEENAPSASQCIGCGHVFANTEAHASGDAVLSEDLYTVSEDWFEIVDTHAREHIGSKGGRYLLVTYLSACGVHFSRTLLLGYANKAGEFAQKQWAAMTKKGTKYSVGPAEAAALWPEVHRPVEKLKADTRTRKILRTTYRKESQA